MKGYVKRRVGELTAQDKPRLFHTQGYLNDLDTMIQTEYVAQMDGFGGGEAMVKMLVDLELRVKEKR